MKILILNSGSSSQKSALYDIPQAPSENAPIPAWKGEIEWCGTEAELRTQYSSGTRIHDRIQCGSRREATEQLLNRMWKGPGAFVRNLSEISVVGHRVVNGGMEFQEPVIVTPVVKDAIKRMSVFAPLHNRAELEGIEIIEQYCGAVPQVAVFDTAFHSQLTEAAAIYPGPYEWLSLGIRRYGFHGINHKYCAQRAAQLLTRDLRSLRIVTCHLGNGCSLAAIQGGRSVDTTMGFTPLEGLMMGTRSGSIDPGILTYLMRKGGLSGGQIDDLLNTKSGLLGISGISSDMRQIVAAMKEGNPRAKLAFDIFVHRLQSGIGSMAAVLGGIDALVFTAGIGENSSEVRSAACANLGFLGAELDERLNSEPASDREISTAASRARILVVCAQEDWAIARACWDLSREGHHKQGNLT
jgi:acetate kinase